VVNFDLQFLKAFKHFGIRTCLFLLVNPTVELMCIRRLMTSVKYLYWINYMSTYWLVTVAGYWLSYCQHSVCRDCHDCCVAL